MTDTNDSLAREIRQLQVDSARDHARTPTLAAGVRQVASRAAMVLDSFKNLVTGMGVRGRDRTTANQIAQTYLLTYPELTALYHGSGLAKRLTDLPCEDAVRAGWSFDGDEEGVFSKEMSRIGVPAAFEDAMKWQRLHGGALTILLWEDANGRREPLDTPFRPGKGKRIGGVRTHSAAEIWIMPTDIVYDPLSPRYEKPEWFTVRRVMGGPFVVHYSRVLEWLGKRPADRTAMSLDVYRRYWGMGIFQAAIQSLSDLDLTWSAITNLMQESVIGKYSISNLENLLMEKDYDAIHQRMANIELSKSSIRGVLLGAEEKYERDEVKFTGVAEIVDRMMMRVSSEYSIPVSILFGRGPAGMNATGDGDARQYYDTVMAQQNRELTPKLLEMVAAMHGYILPSVPLEQIHPNYRPVWSPSEKELVEMYYKSAQADALNINSHVLTPQEVRKNRFVGGFSWVTSLPPGSEGHPAGTFYDLQQVESGDGGAGGSGGNGPGERNTLAAQVRTPSGASIHATAQTRQPKAGNNIEKSQQ